MYFYQAYGLNISSTLPLPELLQTTNTTPDLEIKFGRVNRSLMQVNRLGTKVYATSEKVSLCWNEVGAISIENGTTIILDPIPDVEDRLFRLPILGIAFAVVLQQRGLLALHASAIEINGSAAICMAGRGWGKSTLAATLYGRGHRLIADDLVAVDASDEVPRVLPGFPQLKLLPEAAKFALGDDPETLPRLATGYEKRSRRNLQRFSQNPLPIKGIFKLTKGSVPTLKSLSPQKATAELIGNIYPLSGIPQLAEGKAAISLFHKCMNVIQQVPIYYLERPQNLKLVPELAKIVEENFADKTYLTTV